MRTRPTPMHEMMTTPIAPEVHEIVAAIGSRQRFVVSSHARPDGDSIGSELAMAYALRALNKNVRVVNSDQPPAPFLALPGVASIEIAATVDGDFDASLVMECSDLGRTGVTGLDRGFVINVDHHPGNTGYGDLRWFDPSAAACAEMVYTLIEALGVPITPDIATHLYVAILTDTGSFHYSNITRRTFDIAGRLIAAGVDPVRVARQVYDSNNLGRLRLFGAVLNGMQIDPSGRVAVLYLDHQMAREAGATYDDTDGLINMPLTVKDIQAVVFFKQSEGDDYRVSMRSKDRVDISAVAKLYGGGGHKNAAGCSVSGSVDVLQKIFVDQVTGAIAAVDPP